VDEGRDWQAEYERTYAGPPSTVHERVWRQVFGDDYPEGVDPFSCISKTELDRIANEVRVGSGDTLADFGCGRGGPGLWIAMATDVDLIGIDIAENALVAARQRAESLGVAGRTSFLQASFENTGLRTASVDAVVSIDALLFAADKAAAVAEVRRVVRDGGRFVLTSWDYHQQPVGRPPQISDHRPLLTSGGFAVLAYEETSEWRRRTIDTTVGLLENVEGLAAESGEDVAEVRARLEEMHASTAAMSRRILAVAEAV
jgi:ubiquinone/menaquinone biosynthesis C-methylase UbiE